MSEMRGAGTCYSYVGLAVERLFVQRRASMSYDSAQRHRAKPNGLATWLEKTIEQLAKPNVESRE
jgi:hypothetical protein